MASRKADEATEKAAPEKRMLEAGADEASKVPEAAAETAREVTDMGAKAAQRSLRVVEASADIAKSAGDAATESTRQMAEWELVRRNRLYRLWLRRAVRPASPSSP